MQNNSYRFLKVTNKLVEFLPLAFWVFLIFGFDSPHIGFLTIACALIHESGHMLAILAMKKTYSLYSTPLGFTIKINNKISYKQELVAAIGGPILNLISAAFVFIFGSRDGYIGIFGYLNLFTAISNLLPIEGLDGYRIIKSAVLIKSETAECMRVLHSISFSIITLFTFFSLYLIERIDGGYWIFLIFLTFLLKNIKNDKRIFLREKERKREKTRDFES